MVDCDCGRLVYWTNLLDETAVSSQHCVGGGLAHPLGCGQSPSERAKKAVTAAYTVTPPPEAVVDVQRLQDFIVERELEPDSQTSQTPYWTAPQRALDAL